jgi:hypothetical protein
MVHYKASTGTSKGNLGVFNYKYLFTVLIFGFTFLNKIKILMRILRTLNLLAGVKFLGFQLNCRVIFFIRFFLD